MSGYGWLGGGGKRVAVDFLSWSPFASRGCHKCKPTLVGDFLVVGWPWQALATFATLHFPSHCTAYPIREPDLHDGPHCDTSRYTASPPLSHARGWSGSGRLARVERSTSGQDTGRVEDRGGGVPAGVFAAATRMPSHALGCDWKPAGVQCPWHSFMLHLGNRSDVVFQAL
jgi:hypothetical protein